MSRRSLKTRPNPTTSREKAYNEVISKICDYNSRTIADRMAAIILLSAGLSEQKTADIVGVNIRQIKIWNKAIENETASELLTIKPGQGRKRKLADYESEIFDEIENGGVYTSRKEIAMMIENKFGVKVDVRTVGRLLKKGASKN